MKAASTYEFDADEIQREVYYLVCMLFANKEIARTTDSSDAIARVEARFRTKELTSRLLAVAIKMRAVEDQMRALPEKDPARRAFFRRRDEVDQRYSQAVFDQLTLRQICNKIVHATIFELYEQEGEEPHESCPTRFADIEEGVERVRWKHWRTDWLRIGNAKEDWYLILDLPKFASAICEHFESR